MKAESDKTIRDTIKRTKEMIETDRVMHNRELDSKDRQMKDKLKKMYG